jgi:O-antigen/teichoic acid export membrane protein
LESQADTVLLSAFHNYAEVGRFGAATTVASSLLMFSQSYRYAVYPLMARYASESPVKLLRLYERSIRYMAMLVLPMVAGIGLLAPQIVPLVFGPSFQPTVPVLRVLILALVFLFLNEPSSRMMLVHDRQRQISLFLLGSAALNILLNILLIPSWGALGAATARLSSSMLFFAINYLYIRRFLMRANIVRSLSRPVVATAVMVCVVWSLQGQTLPLSIGAGALTYTGTLWLLEHRTGRSRRFAPDL